MRLAIVAAVVGMSALSAHADTLQFSFVGNDFGVTRTILFQAPSDPIPDSANPTWGFSIKGVTATIDGVALTNRTLNFFIGSVGGGFSVAGASDGALVFGPQLFTGSTAMPLLQTGTFFAPFAYVDLDTVPFTGVLTVTKLTSVTPEPSSIALLGTGVLGVAGAFRKRSAQPGSSR